MTWSALPGRVLVDIIPHEEKHGLLWVVTRKELPLRGLVLSVGGDYLNRKGRVFSAPAQVGDIVHFKGYTPKSLQHYGRDGKKRGVASIWFDEILAVDKKTGGRDEQ